METWKLEAFVKTIDLGSISRAAGVLHIAQSALSQQLSSLEAKLGVTLMVRTRQGVVPTAAGQLLYRRAQHILREVDAVIQNVREVSEEPRGRVSVALAPYGLAASITRPLIEAVQDIAPHVVLHIREDLGGSLNEAIAAGQIDIGLMYTPVPLRAISVEVLHHEPLVLAVPRSAGFDSPVALPDLVDYGVFLPSRQHSVRLSVDAAFQKHNLFPKLAGEIDSMSALLDVVAHGCGGTIMPRSAFPDESQLPAISFHDLESPVDGVGVAMCTPRDHALTDEAFLVYEILLKSVRGHLEKSRS